MIKEHTNSQENYNKFLKETLKKKTYQSASDLSELLIGKFKVSGENSRKIISRAVAQKVIKSSHPYTFGKGQFIYFSENRSIDVNIVKAASKNKRPPIYRLIDLLERNDGIISYYEALKITASPLQKSSTKVDSLDDILIILSGFNLIHQKRDGNGVNYVILKNKKNVNELYLPGLMATHFSKMVLDSAILPDILRWLQRTNLIDNSDFLYRNKKAPQIGVKHSNLVWDALAYTRTTGINLLLGAKAQNKENKTLVVLDVVLSQEYSQSHLDAYISRIQIHRNSVKDKTRKILPIIVFQNCSVTVLNRIKKNGILTYDLSTIFGTKIYQVMEAFHELSISLISHSGIEETIEKILKNINDAGQEDALRELRGTLFEFLMYPLLKTLFPNASIERARKITITKEDGNEETYEYDYIIDSSNPSELIFIELKGYHAGAYIPKGNLDKKASLTWFFRRTLPAAIKSYNERIKNGREAKAVFITSANFWEDGKKLLIEMNKSKFKSSVLDTGYDREGLLKLLKSYSLNTEIRVIKKFYAKPDESE
ncbi:hypothetical protein HMPREF9714_02828 [Myroides odoratimimus CCUG 12901]|uniref:hypothetical protein n=1 Tax=Myroides odoratimimus TaxID=76832 RepID=UPI00024614E9|nr:hypothetical protein [Myroides odoratimimus]EHO06977.1 hypothetical protein HMPREF9714_02828 [Myroides odoratimimus CCUG 12901]